MAVSRLPTPPVAKLPVWQTTIAAYGRVRRHLGVYSAQIAAFAAPYIAAALLTGSPDGRADVQSGPDAASVFSSLGEVLASALLLFGTIAVGVECHRAVVLGIRPTIERAFRFGWRELNVLGVGLVWFLLAALVAMLPATILGPFIGFHIAQP